MDILYILGTGSNWDNNELRYSLRSIEKFGKNINEVYVVGSDPGFLSNEVTYIKCPDIWSSVDKHKNMLYKLVYATCFSNIADEFLVSSDDHFYIKETDFKHYPYYYKGVLKDNVEDGIEGLLYRRSLYDTRQLLEKYDYPFYNLTPHRNVHCSRKAINLAKDLINESYTTPLGCEPYCLILNVLYKHIPFELTEIKDKKVNKEITTREELLKYIGNSEVFSISDDAIEVTAKAYLEELFPNKSKYEI